MPNPTLPPEILRAIINENSWPQWPDWEDGGRTFAACCLAGRALLPFARERLYQDVRLRIEPLVPPPSPPPLLPRRKPAPPLFGDWPRSRRSDRLLRTLATSLHLAQLVKTIEIAVNQHAAWVVVKSTVEAALGACREVTDIYLWVSTLAVTHWLEELLKGPYLKLETLRLHGEYAWNPSGLASMLAGAHPRLRHLYINNLDLLGATATPLSLHLETCFIKKSVGTAVLDQVLGQSHQSLKALTFMGVTGCSYDLAPFTYLTSLDLTWPLWRFSDADTLHLFRSIGSCTALQELYLNCSEEFGTLELPCLEEIRFLHMLPPTLLRIATMQALAISTRYLLDVLGDRRCLPALRHLEVGRYLEDDEDDGAVRRPREELDALAAAAEMRGVDLGWEGAEESEAEMITMGELRV